MRFFNIARMIRSIGHDELDNAQFAADFGMETSPAVQDTADALANAKNLVETASSYAAIPSHKCERVRAALLWHARIYTELAEAIERGDYS